MNNLSEEEFKRIRYPKDWSWNIAPKCRKSTKGLCSRCWQREVKVAHHILYRVLIFIKPRCWAIGFFIVPLCSHCHDIVHDRAGLPTRNWKKFKHRAVTRNANTFGCWISLMIRYWSLRLIQSF